MITAEWINYLPGNDRVWVPKTAVPIGFIDDGRAHNAGQIHVDRVAVFDGDPRLSLGPIKLLHFQYVDWARMKSKQRRYQCMEVLWHPEKRPVQIYRQYHRMDAAPESQLRQADPRGWTATVAEASSVANSRRPTAMFSGGTKRCWTCCSSTGLSDSAESTSGTSTGAP